ncbi:MAG TPA: hypothetical protein VK203_15210 [Nostocaceae cyanobacterium]|nr:hypothetical protein [Nostocaceae cyanobacterium]
MLDQASLHSDQVSACEDGTLEPENHNLPKQPVTTSIGQQVEEYVDTNQVSLPQCIRLSLNNLKCFEVVECQYEQWGVIFHNSLAIQPSNPAFPTHSGGTVLMGSPKNGFLEATFLRPVQWVSAVVTSSQQLVLSAYDQNGQQLAQSTLPTANLANSDSSMPPNTLLSVAAIGITRVTFCAFDGQFTLDDFRFCF